MGRTPLHNAIYETGSPPASVSRAQAVRWLLERGFIEYIPGEHAWRAIHADGSLVIHCLWVVGKSKGKGLAGSLLDACLADAKRSGMKGVAMVTSEKVWLAGRPRQ